jgi:peptide/nickel transport system permease protein
LTAFIVLVAVFGPFVAPHSPDTPIGPPFASPSTRQLFGTDVLGRDVFSRTLWGGRTVVGISLAATILGFVVGIAIGLASASATGWADDAITGGMDVILAFPQIVLALLFVSMLGTNLYLITAVVALSHMPRVARLTRGMALGVMQMEFVQATAIIGIHQSRILAREVLPNISTPLFVEFGIRLSWTIAIVAGLSFVGFGVQPPTSDWGLAINENRNAIGIQPIVVLVPAICISIFAIGTNLLAEGVARASAGVDSTGTTR